MTGATCQLLRAPLGLRPFREVCRSGAPAVLALPKRRRGVLASWMRSYPDVQRVGESDMSPNNVSTRGTTGPQLEACRQLVQASRDVASNAPRRRRIGPLQAVHLGQRRLGLTEVAIAEYLALLIPESVPCAATTMLDKSQRPQSPAPGSRGEGAL